MEAACGAALLRDAGATALLSRDYEVAVGLLSEAGSRWANLGLFAGYALLRLSKGRNWRGRRESEVEKIQELLIGEPEIMRAASEDVSFLAERPFFDGSMSSSRQLLNLYQAVLPNRAFPDKLGPLRDQIRHRLEGTAWAAVGSVDVPMTAYLRLLDDAASGDISGISRKSFSAIVLQRDNLLRTAREDTFRWMHVLNPVDLIDFDFLAVCLAASETEVINEFNVDWADLDPMLRFTASLPAHLSPELPPSDTLKRHFRWEEGGGTSG